ncbi:MAG TPA: hypothetical protein VGY54_09695 [Polyangiaceae bacterium]|jgi:hypothetical protein|nr:hypothetical protein [Polyangiaceae bacterium]
MSESDSELSFDRATYAKGEGAACTSCKGPLGGSYWKWQQHVVCAGCREGLQRSLAQSQSPARLAKAVMVGGGTALACGAAYAVVTAATNVRFALATIGIAFVIAKVVRQASGGIGGVRFQVVAVALTYLAATMGYIPEIWAGITGNSHAKADARHSDHSGDGAAADAEPDQPKAQLRAGALVYALAVLVGIMLSAPFLTFTQSPLGLLIVFFGLWEAWKLSRGPPLELEGPYRVAPVAIEPPAT